MKILIAYDGSEGAKAAIAGLASAGLPDDTVAVVTTASDVLPGLLDPAVPGEPMIEIVANARADAQRATAEAEKLAGEGAKRVAELFPAWQVTSEPIADSPYWGFVNRASRSKPDLIVVGSRGHSAIQSAILGSVSQNVMHYANGSVRIGRAAGVLKPGSPVKILVAFDGSPSAERAVASVAARSWPQGSEARIVTAAHGQTLAKLVAEGFEGEIPPIMEKVAAQLRSVGLKVSTAVREDDPKDALLEEAREWGAHCIFVGDRGLGGMARVLLGSVSAAIAARAHCSVEVVRAGDS
jgi:nucleotide-binding universal stress UspA family protein